MFILSMISIQFIQWSVKVIKTNCNKIQETEIYNEIQQIWHRIQTVSNKMMKKYFLKGKEYLSKKLQELEITTGNIDYVAQQIPNRLKQPLSVLQQQEIDIEDSHAYETYFKNYPNHHLSHFLLDKYTIMLQAEAEPNKYLLPANSQSHIPSFDQKLQKKALLLREAIEEYDEGYAKNDEPIICLCVINFHHKRGTQIQYRYPQSKAVEALESMIVHHAMPDSSHNKAEDYNFFNFQADYKNKKRMLFGVSYFKQIKLTQNMKKQNSEFTRSYLQKAVAIVSTVPLFGYLKIKLSITTKMFFEKFTCFQIIESAYKQLNKQISDSWPNMQINDLYIGSDLKAIMSLFTVSDFYQIWKAVLYQKRIVVFAHSSSSASSFILSLMSLFPGLSTFGIYSQPIAKYMQSLRQLALPLRLFNSQNFLSISFHIQDFWQLAKFKKSDKGNFLLGTTNRLLKQNNDYGIQLLVNLENCTIQKFKSRRQWETVGKKQRNFIRQLQEIVHKQKDLGYGGSQDCIRDHFHNFLKGALIQIIQGIKQFQKFVIQCQQYIKTLQSEKQFEKQDKQGKVKEHQQKQKQQQSKSNDFPPLFPQQTSKMIFSELLLQKSFAYFRQFKNENLPEIVSGKLVPSLFISNYDYLLRLPNMQFISYNWIDKKLSFGRGTAKDFQGKQIKFKGKKNEQGNDLTKSIYVGHVEKGKFSKNGFYFDEFENYEGQYSHGLKEGYGKFLNGSQKYLGNFHQNQYEGQGQLIAGGDIYVGQFKQGQKHGIGSMQGSNNFVGRWEHDKPIIQLIKQQANRQETEQQNNLNNTIDKQESTSNQNKQAKLQLGIINQQQLPKQNKNKQVQQQKNQKTKQANDNQIKEQKQKQKQKQIVHKLNQGKQQDKGKQLQQNDDEQKKNKPKEETVQ